MNLVNHEERDGEEIHIAIKAMTAAKLNDSQDRSPFRKLLTIKTPNLRSDTAD